MGKAPDIKYFFRDGIEVDFKDQREQFELILTDNKTFVSTVFNRRSWDIYSRLKRNNPSCNYVEPKKPIRVFTKNELNRLNKINTLRKIRAQVKADIKKKKMD